MRKVRTVSNHASKHELDEAITQVYHTWQIHEQEVPDLLSSSQTPQFQCRQPRV
jgi:hypothetical protein